MPEVAVTRWLADFGTRSEEPPTFDHPQAQGIRDRPRHLKAL
jgi:hypothetical protein